MKIVLEEIPVRAVVDGYVDSAEEGVIGYGGKLNIRKKINTGCTREFTVQKVAARRHQD